MCGIVGFYNAKGWNPSHLRKMTDALKHRGPDDEGFYFNKELGVGLGHRRLSILDVSAAARQPMTYSDSGCWIAYNGEVYNFIELRNQLKTKGYKFWSDSDTEVVLVSFLEWGENAFQKFNGMWALAIYDETRNRLLLCRDRYGIKPLYYYWNGKTLVFSSEYKALWSVEDLLCLEWDHRGLKTAMINPFQLESSGFSLIRNVYNLLPGHLLYMDIHGCRTLQWWKTLDYIQDVPSSLEEQAEHFLELFEDACRLRLRSDVPIGTSLSGGLDSSSIVMSLSRIVADGLQRTERITSDWQKTFIHSFPGSDIDETADAIIVADAAGAHKTIIHADSNDICLHMDNILYQFESIYCGIPDSAWRVYKAQRENGVIVSLDGHGCDEMLGGYGPYLNAAIRDQQVWHPRFWQLLSQQKELYGGHLSWNSYLKTLLGSCKWQVPFRRVFKQLKKVAARNKSTDFFSEYGISIELYPEKVTKLPRSFSALDKALYQDFHHLVLPRILKNFDLMSMAHGVEVRMPFMDYRIVNFVFSLPPESKIGQGYTKLVLRRAMEGILPDRIRLRKRKIGFNSPVVQWLQNELRPWVEECLFHSKYEHDLLDKKKMQIFYKQRVLSQGLQWNEALDFWKYLNALNLTRLVNLA